MTKEIIMNALLFTAGAAIGSVVTWKLVKTKYEQIAQEEIESVKEAFSNRDIAEKGDADEDTKEYMPSFDSLVKQAEEISKKAGYTSEPDEEKEEEEENDMMGPYIITPEEFGDSDYTPVTLNYYTDGVVTNARGKIVANVDELVGKDFADHFGEYEDDPDCVYVRDDDSQIDYEILRDYRAYSEIYQ